MTQVPPSASPPRSQVLAAYGVLYLVWGSTYLAMKLAVQTLPPFTTAALRFVFSGLLLLVIGMALDKTKITARHLAASMSQGVLLLVFGNAAVRALLKSATDWSPTSLVVPLAPRMKKVGVELTP